MITEALHDFLVHLVCSDALLVPRLFPETAAAPGQELGNCHPALAVVVRLPIQDDLLSLGDIVWISLLLAVVLILGVEADGQGVIVTEVLEPGGEDGEELPD